MGFYSRIPFKGIRGVIGFPLRVLEGSISIIGFPVKEVLGSIAGFS